MTKGLLHPSLLIHKTLDHLETGVAHLKDGGFTHQVVMEMDGHLEIEIDMDQHIFKGKPVDLLLEGMFKKAASTHVEVVALRPVVDVVVGVEIAHADLDGAREHNETVQIPKNENNVGEDTQLSQIFVFLLIKKYKRCFNNSDNSKPSTLSPR
jgi:hypothetical protein